MDHMGYHKPPMVRNGWHTKYLWWWLEGLWLSYTHMKNMSTPISSLTTSSARNIRNWSGPARETREPSCPCTPSCAGGVPSGMAGLKQIYSNLGLWNPQNPSKSHIQFRTKKSSSKPSLGAQIPMKCFAQAVQSPIDSMESLWCIVKHGLPENHPHW